MSEIAAAVLAEQLAELAEQVRLMRAYIAPGAGERLTYTKQELAAVTGVSERKIDNATASGELPSFLWGGLRMYPADGVRAWIARRVDQERAERIAA